MGKRETCFFIDQHLIPYVEGQTVLEAACQSRIPMPHSCGGMGTCGTCRVIVESDLSQLPPREEIELEMASERVFRAEERLGCQLVAQAGLRLCLPNRRDEAL